MSPSIALVVSNTSSESGPLLAARLRHLLGLGWDARLLCKGEGWARNAALRDPALGDRVELAPAHSSVALAAALLARPTGLARYLTATGESGPFDGRLLRLRPDLIHFHSGWAAWKGMRLKELVGCRVVISFRDDGRDLGVPDPRRLWDGADLVLFPSAAMLRRATARGCPGERAEVLSPPPGSAQEGATERSSPPGVLRVLSWGPLIWEQGLEHSVHAVRLLLDRGVNCTYRIVGAGDHLPAVAFARHQLGLAGHVELVAPDAARSLADELRAADVFVDPAVSATISSAPLLTAQALGVPFVATRRDDLPRDAGIAVPRRDPGAIAQGLARLAADALLRREMGQAGRRHAAERPALAEHLQRLEGLYRRALG